VKMDQIANSNFRLRRRDKEKRLHRWSEFVTELVHFSRAIILSIRALEGWTCPKLVER
jgi:hypothetical protein